MEATFENTPEYNKAHYRVVRIRAFYHHLIVFLAVNTGLLIMNLMKTPNHLWIVWPLAGWGIGLLFHGISVYSGATLFGAKWEERKIRKIMERQK